MARVVRRSFLGRIRDAQTAKLVNFGLRIKDKFTYKLPDKYKDTWVDRLVTYWQSLVRDYTEAGLDTLRDIRDKPLKAATYGGLLGTSYFCAVRNPDDRNYRACLIEAHTDMAYTSVNIQNKKAITYLKTMEDYHNSGVIRYFSFGLFSIMWLDNYNQRLGLFEAKCEYLQPTYLEIMQKRIVDVGFLNQWWLLKKNMKDFDVNDEEWVSSAASGEETESVAIVRE